ncbi:MAG: hypothetical protein ACI4MN_03865 [Candidatus Coproplasma sp.]
MRNASVAVLDIRSDEICAVIAEKGVNNTFIIKNKYSQHYEGYAEGEFLDKENFISALSSAAENLYLSAGGKIKSVYVSVPVEFLELIQADKVVTYRSSQKIGARHIEEVKKFSTPKTEKGYSVCACDCLFFYLSDKRKVLNPVGAVSDSLRARCCFYACKTGFIKAVKQALKNIDKLKEIHWIPQNRAEAFYLVPEEKRGGYTILLDFGYISSSFSVIYGNGIAFSESFSIGIGHMAALVMETLEVPFEVASELIRKVNLNSKGMSSTMIETIYEGKRYAYSSAQLKDILSEGLDAICETIETCRQSFMGKDLSSVPIMITGEGVGVLRGMTEHVSSRLVTPVEIVSPSLPYYGKPVYSSLFSLLAAALN